MFVSVHSKEFNAPPLLVEGSTFISSSEQRRNAMAVLWDCLGGKVVFEEENVVGFRKEMPEGVYYCCRCISQVVDTAGRKLPFLFCMQKGEDPANFAVPLKVLADRGYCLSPEESAAIRRCFDCLSKKKGLWDWLTAVLRRIINFFIGK